MAKSEHGHSDDLYGPDHDFDSHHHFTIVTSNLTSADKLWLKKREDRMKERFQARFQKVLQTEDTDSKKSTIIESNDLWPKEEHGHSDDLYGPDHDFDTHHHFWVETKNFTLAEKLWLKRRELQMMKRLESRLIRVN